jgi:hypothetical protein
LDNNHVREFANGAKIKLCSSLKHDGSKCMNVAMKDRDHCKHHGGTSLIGPDSPAFKTGLWSKQRRRFSKVAPTLLTRIDELRDDPDLFSLKDDAAYLTALMDIRAESASHGVNYQHYQDIQAVFNQMARAKRTGDQETFEELFKNLGDKISNGVDLYQASNDVIALIEKRTDIVEAEQKMLHTKAYTLEVDQAYSLVMQVIGIVKANVRHHDEMVNINTGIGKLLKQYQDDPDIIDAEVVDNEE